MKAKRASKEMVSAYRGILATLGSMNQSIVFKRNKFTRFVFWWNRRTHKRHIDIYGLSFDNESWVLVGQWIV